MKYMAHIVEGKVVDVSLWDGLSEWEPGDDLVEIPLIEFFDEETGETRTMPSAGIDWDYIDGSFVDNRPRPEIF